MLNLWRVLTIRRGKFVEVKSEKEDISVTFNEQNQREMEIGVHNNNPVIPRTIYLSRERALTLYRALGVVLTEAGMITN